MCSADVRDLGRIGRDDDVIQLDACPGGMVNVPEHGMTVEFAQNFARQAGRSEASGNDGDGFQEVKIPQGLKPEHFICST